MRPFDDSFAMTPDERRAAIARILAAGLLRLHSRAALPPADASPAIDRKLGNPGSQGLEVSEETELIDQSG